MSKRRKKRQNAPQASNIIVDSDRHVWRNISNWSVDTMAGEEVSDQSVLTSSTCYACTKVLSETAAGLPTAIMRQLKKKREEVENHSALDLLCEMANPEMNSYTFIELAVTRIKNSGNFYAEIQRDGRDRPIALWPIHPSRVQPLRDESGMLYWEITGDYSGAPAYGDPSWRQTNLRWLSNRNMLNIVGFGSHNGIIGPGISPGASEIGIDFAVRRYGAEFFRNGGVPLGIVEHPAWQPDPNKRREFRDDINKIHTASRHQTGVLWEGAKYHEIGISPEGAQMLETRKYTAHQLCYMYGVPPPIIGDLQDSKFSTAEAAIQFFVMMTIRNLVERIERSINTQVLKTRTSDGLVTAFNDKLIYRMAIDGLLRGNPETQAKVWESYRKMGVASTNDIRKDLDMNPIEGEHGEYLLVAPGSVRLEHVDNQGNRQQSAEQAYDKDKLVSMLEKMDQKPQVPGFSAIRESIVEISQEAIGRINAITETQVTRWREQDPKVVAEKMPEFWAKQQTRLCEALQPAERLASRSNLPPVAQSILDDFKTWCSKLDNYTIFSSAKFESQALCNYF